jgi:hypothetical protein
MRRCAAVGGIVNKGYTTEACAAAPADFFAQVILVEQWRP